MMAVPVVNFGGLSDVGLLQIEIKKHNENNFTQKYT